MISQMREISKDLIVQKNDKSKTPVTQLFIKSKRLWKEKHSAQDMEKRKLRGEVQESVEYMRYTLFASDQATFLYSFEEHGEGQETQIQTDEWQGGPVYQEWLQGPSEVQWMAIELPAVQRGQYYLLDTATTQYAAKVPKIVLVYPKYSAGTEA